MSYHLFGIRHHGPGSARSLCHALTALSPDVLLIEGPPEANALLTAANHAQMQPPVALLIYAPDNPADAFYYPFAVFSPEWQAIQYALSHHVPVRFMDLPVSHRIAIHRDQKTLIDESANETHPDQAPTTEVTPDDTLFKDPLLLLAQAAGYDDSERWWEHMVEERRDSRNLFAAINEAMTSLREQVEQDAPATVENVERQREAYMRKTMRATQKEGFQRIAVVCGAWHVPALATMASQKDDNLLLKGLNKVKVSATWVPWTYGRLSNTRGYGAGVAAPEWYHHLWTQSCHTQPDNLQAPTTQDDHAPPNNIAIHWMIRVARALREQGIEVSSAHIIEAIRLAEALAALRHRPLPALPEFNDATEAVMLFGETAAMQLVHDTLIVGQRLGQVPNDIPMTPLQQDLQAQQKRLRFKPSAADETLVFDLRKATDLKRSYLLHQLNILEIPWGQAGKRVAGKGTYKESWRIQWLPDFAIKLIEAGRWGNCIEQAASAAIVQQAKDNNDIAFLAKLAKTVLVANLTQAIDIVMQRLQTQAAVASDVLLLMQAVPELARLSRYGDVRNTAVESVTAVLDGLLTRIYIGLINTCSHLNQAAADDMFQHMQAVHDAIQRLNQTPHFNAWQKTLLQVIETEDLHHLIKGCSCRLLLDSGGLSDTDVARHLSLALSLANEPIQTTAWLDGFLRGSGQLLIHDENLWQFIDDWLCQLSETAFTQILPLLRRTFASFEAAERRQMGHRVKQGEPSENNPVMPPLTDFNQPRAESTLPLLATLLGIK